MVELTNFFELTSDLMGVVGTGGQFQVVNAAFTRTLGYTSDEIIGRDFLDLVHPNDRANSKAQLDQLTTSQSATIHFTNRYA